jgi:hypothetical protein
MTAEQRRMAEVQDDAGTWRRWGPYLSERSWGTVREDYSPDGNAWEFLPHDLARSKAYRWGEDGIAGICDRFQILCFAPAFWNGRDPILKERLFGLNPLEGNHGEDVKEYYFHLDNLPSHAYMKYLYKYPQAEYPYVRLIEENQRRHGQGPEFELADTGIFDEDRYFDITIEYAKAAVEDVCIRITATNRGPDPAPLHILPHLWFRNTWSWGASPRPEPIIRLGPESAEALTLISDDEPMGELTHVRVHYRRGRMWLDASPGGRPLFTENETNAPRVFGPGNTSRSLYVKDAFHRHVIHGEPSVNPANVGTKAALHYRFDAIPPGESAILRLRLSDRGEGRPPLDEVDRIIAARRAEADEFHASIHPRSATDDERMIQRQALAGLLWNKQCYLYDVNDWIQGDDPRSRPPSSRQQIRNQNWRHLNSMRIMSVPDKWEYPWFAAWDLAFHTIALTLVDPRFAKEQLVILLLEQFLHPNGQMPAYEWEFSDLNPPVHSWAVWRVYNMDRIRSGKADRDFLETCFQKLMLNFVFWVNKVDSRGNNIFEGGFLGLDNITIFDRSVRCQDGSIIEQADSTAWMGMFCLNMMRIALELAKENRVYEGLATKFFQHYIYIASAMKNMGGRDYQLWDDVDGFFYDVLVKPDGHFQKIRVRSLVGLIPFFAVERLEEDWIAPFRDFRENLHWFLRYRQDLVENVVHTIVRDGKTTHLLTIMDEGQLGRMVERMWDPAEFLSRYGIRSLSKAHETQPFMLDGRTIRYEPAEAVSKIKGGNSNWRGPIWMPTCFLVIESLRKLAKAYGLDYAVRIPCLEGPGGRRLTTFPEMSRDLAERLIGLFARDPDNGRRPAFGDDRRFGDDPHWRDLLLFYEYFDGDTGRGLGSSHQTGWSALVASLIDEWRLSS